MAGGWLNQDAGKYFLALRLGSKLSGMGMLGMHRPWRTWDINFPFPLLQGSENTALLLSLSYSTAIGAALRAGAGSAVL